MKAVIIGIVLLFVGIFGAKKFYEIKEVKETEKAEKEYKDLLKAREDLGDSLSKATLLAQLAADDRPSILGSEAFRAYFSEDGYNFNASALVMPPRFGQTKAQKMFGAQVGKFGPAGILEWKRFLIPAVKTNPTNRMLAAKVLRKFEAWNDPVRNLQDVFFKVENENGILGLHFLREKEAKERAAALAKVKDFVEAQITLGRLQLNKQNRTFPYQTARDLILFSNMFINEAVEDDENRLSSEIDDVVNKYLVYLAANGGDSEKMVSLQNLIVEDDLSQALFTRIRLKRISTKGALEKQFLAFTKQERDALGIFESGYVLTPKEMWLLLGVYANVGIIMNYDDEGEKERMGFTGEVLDEAGSYLNEKKQELALNKDADKLFTSTMRKLEEQAFIMMAKLAERYEVAIDIAIYRYKDRTDNFPKDFSDLTTKDLPYSPVNPLTGEPFKVTFSKSKKEEELEKKPGVKVTYERRSRIK